LKQVSYYFLTKTNSLFNRCMCHDFDSQGPKSESFNFWNCCGSFFVDTLSVNTYSHTHTQAPARAHTHMRLHAHTRACACAHFYPCYHSHVSQISNNPQFTVTLHRTPCLIPATLHC
jgi:hypothetical protein